MNGKIPQLPDAELDIMTALWENGKPMMVSEIHSAIQRKRKCTKPAVHSLVDRLAQKGFVDIKVIEKPIAYKLISPAVTRSEYGREATNGFVKKVFGGSWKHLIAGLAESGSLSESEMRELADILNRKAGGSK